jgi:tape measure domain-containing protein|nr:MAG TPA: tail tape measure protein [Bacteriophage sp.]
MAQELTANFGANSTKFSKGVQEIKAQITELNKALELNKQAIADTNKKAKEYEKELDQLKTAEKENGTATEEQKARMSKLEKEIDKARTRAAQLKAEQIDLKTELKETTSELKKQKSGVSGVSDEMKKMKTLITGFIAAYGGKKLWDLLIGSNAEMEQYTTSLEVMLGSASKASAMIEKMRDFAAKTPLTLENVISGGSLLMSYGVDESNLIDTMTKLGDLASGNAEKMDRITLAYGQMLAKGKVTGEELMQMTEAGVPLQTALAESIGVTGEEFSKMVSAGKVGIDDLNKAITGLTTGDGKFAGMMEKQSQTMQGMLSTLQDNISEFLRKMGEGAFGEVKSALQEASDLLAEWEEDGTLDRWAQGVGVMLKNLIAFLKTAISVGLDFKEAIIAGAVALGTFKIAIGIGNVISAAVAAVKSFTTATKAATTAQAAFNAVGAANPYVLLGSLALAAVSAIGGAFAMSAGNAADSVDKLHSSIGSMASEAQSFVDENKKLSQIISDYKNISESSADVTTKAEQLNAIQQTLNATFSDSASNIDLVNGKYEEQLKLLKNLSEDQKNREINRIKKDLATSSKEIKEIEGNSFTFDFQYTGKSKDILDERINSLMEKYNTNPAFAKINIPFGMTAESGSFSTLIQYADIDEQIDIYQSLKDAILETGEANGELSDTYDTVFDRLKELQDIKNNNDSLKDSLAALTTATENTTKKTEENTETKNNNIKTTEELADSTSTLVKNLNELASAYAEQVKNGNISYDTMLKLIDAGYTQCISLDNETGKIKLNTEAYKELAKAKLASQIAEYDATIGTPNINSYYDQQEWEAKKDLRLKRDALKAMYDNFDTYMESGSFSGTGNASEKSSTSSADNEYKKASEAYKTEADKKIALIKRELEAKKELRDATIKAIDDEIEARKRLNEDNDLEKQINEVKAQLKYSQLDEFSREQMEKKLQGLYDDKAEKEWQRNAQARKDAANAKYDTEQKNYNNQINSINESLKTVQQIMSAMADGSKSVESIVNNNNTRNNTANVNLIGTALTMAQITKAVKDALMDDIVIR